MISGQDNKLIMPVGTFSGRVFPDGPGRMRALSASILKKRAVPQRAGCAGPRRPAAPWGHAFNDAGRKGNAPQSCGRAHIRPDMTGTSSRQGQRRDSSVPASAFSLRAGFCAAPGDKVGSGESALAAQRHVLYGRPAAKRSKPQFCLPTLPRSVASRPSSAPADRRRRTSASAFLRHVLIFVRPALPFCLLPALLCLFRPLRLRSSFLRLLTPPGRPPRQCFPGVAPVLRIAAFPAGIPFFPPPSAASLLFRASGASAVRIASFSGTLFLPCHAPSSGIFAALPAAGDQRMGLFCFFLEKKFWRPYLFFKLCEKTAPCTPSQNQPAIMAYLFPISIAVDGTYHFFLSPNHAS